MRTRNIAELALYEATRPRDPTVCEPRITINQQPHDAADAARLLGELEQKAEQRIVTAVRVANTALECVVQLWRNHADDSTTARAVYKINGQERTVTHSEHRQSDPNLMREKLAIGLRDKIAEQVANEIIADGFRTLVGSL